VLLHRLAKLHQPPKHQLQKHLPPRSNQQSVIAQASRSASQRPTSVGRFHFMVKYFIVYCSHD
jgi:hypothetical protein